MVHAAPNRIGPTISGINTSHDLYLAHSSLLRSALTLLAICNIQTISGTMTRATPIEITKPRTNAESNAWLNPRNRSFVIASMRLFPVASQDRHDSIQSPRQSDYAAHDN